MLTSLQTKHVDICVFQADQFLDSAMTYTLFEWVKENYDDLVADQLNIPQVVTQVTDHTYHTKNTHKKLSFGLHKPGPKVNYFKAFLCSTQLRLNFILPSDNITCLGLTNHPVTHTQGQQLYLILIQKYSLA